MSTLTFSTTRKFIIVVASLFIFSAFLAINAYAENITDEIFRHQEVLLKLRDQFSDRQKHILSLENISFDQERVLDRLFTVGDYLTRTDNDLSNLVFSLQLINLVTDQRLIPRARILLDLQKKSMTGQMTLNIGFTESYLNRSKDQEVFRMILEARDLLRKSVELVNRVQITNSKSK